MASSKKYGYQLRGEKLALCELDITGSGNGLNYTYEESAGLDIATDPSSWKSPLTTISDGLQLEYLSNDFLLFDINDSINEVSESIPSEFSQMDDVSYVNNTQQAIMDTIGGQTFSSPLVHSQAQNVTQLNGNNGNVLKVSRLNSVLDDINAIEGQNAFLDLNAFNLVPGSKYKFSVNVKFNCSPSTGLANRPTDSPYYFQMYLGSSTTIDGNPPSVNPIDFGAISESYVNINEFGVITNPSGTLNSDWMTYSFEFIAPQENVIIIFAFAEMAGTVGDNKYLYIDNLKLTEIQEDLIDPIQRQIQLPSYAQKALLDYVRGIEAYDNGDLEKWDFFMKQFRSKLERWEDSRITGPRILGPSGSAIR